MVTDKMVEAARVAYSTATGCGDTPHVLDGWIEGALRAALEVALSASDAEPVAWRYGYKDGEVVAWIGVEFFNPARGENIVAEPLYAAPPAVAVKALEWVDVSGGCIAHTPFGTCDARFNMHGTDTRQYEMIPAGGTLPVSFHDSLEAAKAAAQADYEARVRAALASPVNTSAERVNETPKSEHVIPEGWQLVPKQPTKEMAHKAACAHYGSGRVNACGGIEGISMTVDSIDYNFWRAFLRFWKGALAAAPKEASHD